MMKYASRNKLMNFSTIQHVVPKENRGVIMMDMFQLHEYLKCWFSAEFCNSQESETKDVKRSLSFTCTIDASHVK